VDGGALAGRGAAPPWVAPAPVVGCPRNKQALGARRAGGAAVGRARRVPTCRRITPIIRGHDSGPNPGLAGRFGGPRRRSWNRRAGIPRSSRAGARAVEGRTASNRTLTGLRNPDSVFASRGTDTAAGTERPRPSWAPTSDSASVLPPRPSWAPTAATPLIRDAAHARLVEALLRLRHPSWRAKVEAPLRGAGRRSTDLRLDRGNATVLFEVETHVHALEATIREGEDKRSAVLRPRPVGGRRVGGVQAAASASPSPPPPFTWRCRRPAQSPVKMKKRYGPTTGREGTSTSRTEDAAPRPPSTKSARASSAGALAQNRSGARTRVAARRDASVTARGRPRAARSG